MIIQNKLCQGDCVEVMRSLDACCVDLVVTDPPYGYSFMGKDWDKAVPSVQVWRECLRVLKAGAFAFVMSSPRADVLSHMIVNLSDAGFRTDFTPIYWAYASGFPKAMNISKAVDKKHGRLNSNVVLLKQKLNNLRIAKGYSVNQMDMLCGFEAQNFFRTDNHLINIFPRGEKWEKIKSILGDSPELEQYLQLLFKKAEREVVGTGECGNPAAWYSGGASGKLSYDITTPATVEAKLLDGSYGGFQPKPAVEVILVAMKPLSEKTFVDQALKNGKGVTWLDNARIPYQNNVDKEGARWGNQTYNSNFSWDSMEWFKGKGQKDILASEQGRFPANLLVSDDILNNGVITKSGAIKPWHNSKGLASSENEGWKRPWHEQAENIGWDYNGDSGQFSRYFSLDAWFTKQFKRLPVGVQRTFPFLIEPKASKSERNTNLDRMQTVVKPSNMRTCNGTGERSVTQGFPDSKTKNFHPTVKPLQLMSYLITLGSRSGDLVLDPFVGSGTSCLAAKMLGRNYVGVELNKDYFEIAKARVENHKTLFEFTSSVNPLEMKNHASKM